MTEGITRTVIENALYGQQALFVVSQWNR